MELLGLSSGQVLALFAAAGTAVAGLYLLRPRLRPVVVAFAPLWESLLADRRATRLWSRLRRIVSFLVALTVVALLAAATGDPSFGPLSGRARHLVLLLDLGISMQAIDVKPNRFAVARQKAAELIEGLAPADRLLLVGMGAAPTPVSTMTSDRRELQTALAELEPDDVACDLTEGYRFALDALRGRTLPEIVVVSDGVFERDRELERSLADPDIPVRYLPVGGRNHNLSLTALSARRYPLDKNSSEILLEVRNGTDGEREVEVALYGDGVLLKTTRFDVPAGDRVRRFFQRVSGVDRVLQARMTQADGSRDDLAADDLAYAALPPRRKAHVLCVSEGNLYLQAALLLDEYLQVSVIEPAAYRGDEGVDLVAFDRYVPPDPPAVPALYLYPAAGTATGIPLRGSGTIERPYFEKLDRGHPLLRFTALKDVNIGEALRVRPAGGDTIVAADSQGPLLVAGEREGRRFVAFTFDIRKSDLPLRVAWPLLLMNSIDWLIAQRDTAVSEGRAGERLPVRLSPGTRQAEIEFPDGRKRSLPSAGGEILFTPVRAGLYTVRTTEGEHTVPVNPDCRGLDALGPHQRLQIAGREASPPLPAHRGPGERPWVYLVLAALLVVILEWFTYHRRWTV